VGGVTMPLVTDSDVKQILDTTVDTTPFINAADLLITQSLSMSGLSTAMLTEIERWLAAHLTCMMDPRETSKAMGDARVNFEAGRLGMGLQATRYGQQVLLLDTSGTLAAQGLRRTTFQVF